MSIGLNNVMFERFSNDLKDILEKVKIPNETMYFKLLCQILDKFGVIIQELKKVGLLG